MSRETEKIFRELHKYMEQFDGKLTSEEAEKKIDEFLKEYSNNLNNRNNLPQEKDQWYYLDLAVEAEDEKVARKHAQHALTIDPYCTDAEMLLIDLMDLTDEEVKKRYEKLIKKTEAHLEEEGYFDKENEGHFYMILETRPYMRLLGRYMTHLIDMGKYRMAAATGEKMISLNENDNMGARYDLMGIYGMLEEVAAAEKLYQRYKENLTGMLLPLIFMYYKVDDYTKARRYLKVLARVNPDMKKFLDGDYSEEYISELADVTYFAPNTIEEIVDALCRSPYLFLSCNSVLNWMRSEIKKK